MNAVTMTTIATISSSSEPMRPIAGIFSLSIKRLPISLTGPANYIISVGLGRSRDRKDALLRLKIVGIVKRTVQFTFAYATVLSERQGQTGQFALHFTRSRT